MKISKAIFEGINLACSIPEEFEKNVSAVAFMSPNDGGVLVEDQQLEAFGFREMLKLSIAQMEAKLAIHKAALVQVESALESCSISVGAY